VATAAESGHGSPKRDWLKVWAVIGPILTLVLGAFLIPFGASLFAEKPERPIIPGAPEDGVPEIGGMQYGYTLNGKVEVTNRTSDPLQPYTPLNVQNAVSVRPGDQLAFRADCAVTPKEKPPTMDFAFLTIPTALEIVERPTAEPGGKLAPKTKEGMDVLGVGFGWQYDAPLSNVTAFFTARVDTKNSTYLTVRWSCYGWTPDRKPIAYISRAVLRVLP
jgi:hypothetical protein